MIGRCHRRAPTSLRGVLLSLLICKSKLTVRSSVTMIANSRPKSTRDSPTTTLKAAFIQPRLPEKSSSATDKSVIQEDRPETLSHLDVLDESQNHPTAVFQSIDSLAGQSRPTNRRSKPPPPPPESTRNLPSVPRLSPGAEMARSQPALALRQKFRAALESSRSASYDRYNDMRRAGALQYLSTWDFNNLLFLVAVETQVGRSEFDRPIIVREIILDMKSLGMHVGKVAFAALLTSYSVIGLINEFEAAVEELRSSVKYLPLETELLRARCLANAGLVDDAVELVVNNSWKGSDAAPVVASMLHRATTRGDKSLFLRASQLCDDWEVFKGKGVVEGLVRGNLMIGDVATAVDIACDNKEFIGAQICRVMMNRLAEYSGPENHSSVSGEDSREVDVVDSVFRIFSAVAPEKVFKQQDDWISVAFKALRIHGSPADVMRLYLAVRKKTSKMPFGIRQGFAEGLITEGRIGNLESLAKMSDPTWTMKSDIFTDLLYGVSLMPSGSCSESLFVDLLHQASAKCSSHSYIYVIGATVMAALHHGHTPLAQQIYDSYPEARRSIFVHNAFAEYHAHRKDASAVRQQIALMEGENLKADIHTLHHLLYAVWPPPSHPAEPEAAVPREAIDVLNQLVVTLRSERLVDKEAAEKLASLVRVRELVRSVWFRGAKLGREVVMETLHRWLSGGGPVPGFENESYNKS